MPESPRTPRTPPRASTVLDCIRAGKYDNEAIELKKALDERISFKRQEVEELVREVFGPNYTVTARKQPVGEAFVPKEKATEEPVWEKDDEKEGDFESRSPVIGPFNPS